MASAELPTESILKTALERLAMGILPDYCWGDAQGPLFYIYYKKTGSRPGFFARIMRSRYREARQVLKTLGRILGVKRIKQGPRKRYKEPIREFLLPYEAIWVGSLAAFML